MEASHNNYCVFNLIVRRLINRKRSAREVTHEARLLIMAGANNTTQSHIRAPSPLVFRLGSPIDL
jgi:hypothetical protein